MTEVAPQTFDLVGRELGGTLNEARAALEAYAEQPENLSLLERCADELHRAQGVLRVLEIYGAALLAEEMEQVTRYLIETPAERRNQAESLDALLRALVQLPTYLDRVLAGGRDLALVLLPLLNDLRAVRGSPLLSEGTLLLLNLKPGEVPLPERLAPGEPELTALQWARRLRAQFQLGLVGWIRGERVADNLAALAQVATRMEQVAHDQPVFQLWWVIGAVIEALRDGGLEGSVSVKRLLGLADLELKRLYEQDEPRYGQSPPVELLNNLLYYVARASSDGPRVSAVRRSFRLDELLPVDQAIDEARETLSAPSIKLMQTVAAAIREDLGKVKETLEVFVRRGGGQPGELAPQLELLRKIGDTLGVLGLGELRGTIQGGLARLDDIVAGRMPADEPLLVEIATTLIGVEDRLDGSLLRMIVPDRGASGEGAGAPQRDGAGEVASEDFLQVQSAVLRECIVNLARIKDTIAQNVGGSVDAAGLDAWPELIRGIKAGLLLLGRTRAVAVVESIVTCLKRVMQPGGARLAASYLDRLADAIVSVEYYMETLEAGRAEPGYMLDNAQDCLDALLAAPDSIVPTVAPALSPASFAQTVRLDPAVALAYAAPPLPGVEPVPVAPEAPPVLPAAAPVSIPPAVASRAEPLRPWGGDVDPELLAVFIEEAREEAEKISRYFPEWERNVADVESLRTVRRSFHTLKGSGRMVGASELAEFAWSIENLLNRLLDGTLERTPAVAATLREAVAVAPLLIEPLAGGAAVSLDVGALVARAHALAAGFAGDSAVAADAPAVAAGGIPDGSAAHEIEIAADSRTWVGAEVAPVTRAEPPPAAQPEPQPEAPPGVAAQPVSDARSDTASREASVLREIYLRETDNHVHTVRAFIAEQRWSSEPHRLSEAVYRACHTLSGSSKMAEARHGIRLAEPLEHWVRRSWNSGVGLRSADLALLGDCMDAMYQVARRPDESTACFIDHDVLRQRIDAAEADLERRIALAAVTADAAAGDALPSAPQESDQPFDPDQAFDPEIASVFTEEATELLEMIEAALQGWTVSRRDAAALDALKRPLHTLKGGARMAGIRAMGDLSHELETAIGHLELGLVEPDDRTLAALQEGVDELARMRDRVAQGEDPPAAGALLARLQGLPRGADTAASAAAEEATPAAAAELQPIAAADAISFASLAVPPGREPVPPGDRPEMARVDAELLDQLLNNAGEVSIGRARLEQQVGSLDHNLGELARTVTRLKEQLRNLEIETEKQILHRYESESSRRGDFDPLELDRYSSIQQFSRALAETASDVGSIQQLLETLTQDTQNLLQQQARVVTELQNGLMRTRMVPFQRHVQRLSRIVRQAAADTGKRAELLIEGAAGELDRQVLERMLPAFEHVLRNAVVHGIETPEQRAARDKPVTGHVRMSLHREGSEVVVEVSDDGAGMDLDAIRRKGLELGLIRAGQALSDSDAMQLVLEPGFSTADSLTQHAGRGVGMDVVATEIKKLGGALHMDSRRGEGTRFTIRLPFTLAISHALVVRVGDELYALPLPTVEGVVRLPRHEVERHLAAGSASFEHSGQRYRLQQLGLFVGLAPSPLPAQDVTIPVVLVRAGDHSTGLVTDELIGSREIVVKSVGPQISAIRGVSGATVLGDGRIVIILDIGPLVRADWRTRVPPVLASDKPDAQSIALVVDDSITVRRVTQRLLERNGMKVLTARDGLDAVTVLAENLPDVILLDIEMPRMDGYEVAAQVRNDPRTAGIPIIMITSRVGEKHRARAIELGVDDYLGKPYQEAQLLKAIAPLLARRRAQLAASRGGTA